MSIKLKIVVFLTLVSFVLGTVVWHELSSAYRVEQKVELFVPATGYLLGIAEVNAGIARQAKEALDYLVTGEQQDRNEFSLLTKDVERGFELWIESAETQKQLGVLGELEDLSNGHLIQDAYHRWIGHVLGSFDLIDQGQRALAMKQFEQGSWEFLEKNIFTAIDQEMQDGFNEVENAYHELLMAMGGQFWGKNEDSAMLIGTHAAIDNVIAGCRVNSAVGRQFSAFSTYLLTGSRKSLERYEELKIEVRGAINDWFFAAYEQTFSADPQLSTSVSNVSKVVASLESLLALEEQAVQIKQTDGPQQALQLIVESSLESPIGDHLPLMVFSALGASSKELVTLTSKASRQGVVVIGLAFLCILVLTVRVGQNLLFSLQLLQEGMDSVSQGDLQTRIQLNGKDELAQLANHFNRMSDNLFRSREEVEELNTYLEQRVLDRTRELARANQELEAFNSAVSHDLRGPLSVVIGYSELMLGQEQDLGAMLREQLQAILSAGDRMEGIIGTLLDLSRIDTLELQRKKVDLSELAKDVIERYQRQYPNRQVRMNLERQLMVEADFDLLLIVMENLLGNAWKYTSTKQLTEIELGSGYADRRHFFFIRDNGAGFDMADVDKLFLPFKRLHSQEQFSGTGVGLATVQRIIQCHGGEIWAEGEVEKGATFYFTLGGASQATDVRSVIQVDTASTVAA